MTFLIIELHGGIQNMATNIEVELGDFLCLLYPLQAA